MNFFGIIDSLKEKRKGFFISKKKSIKASTIFLTKPTLFLYQFIEFCELTLVLLHFGLEIS